MPRIPSAFEHSHSRHSTQYHSHHDSLAPYSYHHQHPMPSQSRFSPAPTYSSSYASSSSPCSSPPPSSHMMLGPHHPNATMRTAKSGDFTTPGGVYPYQKGKKVTNAQLGHLLDYFAQHDNPSPTRRIEIANQLEMSAKAVGIWFQNERANVKKGRSRAAELLAEEAMHPIVFHSSHRPRPYIVTSSIPHHRSSHHYASPPSYGHTGRSDDAISVYSCESDDDSEATEDIETPLSELVMSRHLPEVRVQLAEGSSDRRDEQIDGEGLMVAKILVDMKFSKL